MTRPVSERGREQTRFYQASLHSAMSACDLITGEGSLYLVIFVQAFSFEHATVTL